MRLIAAFTIEDPTRESALSERGIPHLLIGCALFILVAVLAASLGNVAFDPIAFYCCLAAIAAALVAGICLVRMFYVKETDFGERCRCIVEGEVAAALVGIPEADDGELSAWLERECLTHLGGAAEESVCLVNGKAAFVACFDKSSPSKLGVELLAGDVPKGKDEVTAELIAEGIVVPAPAAEAKGEPEDSISEQA